MSIIRRALPLAGDSANTAEANLALGWQGEDLSVCKSVWLQSLQIDLMGFKDGWNVAIGENLLLYLESRSLNFALFYSVSPLGKRTPRSRTPTRVATRWQGKSRSGLPYCGPGRIGAVLLFQKQTASACPLTFIRLVDYDSATFDDTPAKHMQDGMTNEAAALCGAIPKCPSFLGLAAPPRHLARFGTRRPCVWYEIRQPRLVSSLPSRSKLSADEEWDTI